MVDTVAAAAFRAQMEYPENRSCMDGGDGKAEWASISHGIYICIGAAGVHRSLGVKTSFVQSLHLDSWKPVHLKMMELGGNARFAKFMRDHGVPEDMPIREKYSTRAAAWYRKNLRAEAEGTELPEPLPEGTGHLSAEETLGRSNSGEAVLDRVFAAYHAGHEALGANEARAVVAITGPASDGQEECGSGCCKRVCESLSSAWFVAKHVFVKPSAGSDCLDSPAAPSLLLSRAS
jgi:hypothetical protein